MVARRTPLESRLQLLSHEEHSESIAVSLNRRTEHVMASLIDAHHQRLSDAFGSAPIRLGGGGADGEGRLYLLTTDGKAAHHPDTSPVFDGLFSTCARRGQALLNDGALSPQECDFFAGHWSWAAGKLQKELEAGAWSIGACNAAAFRELMRHDDKAAYEVARHMVAGESAAADSNPHPYPYPHPHPQPSERPEASSAAAEGEGTTGGAPGHEHGRKVVLPSDSGGGDSGGSGAHGAAGFSAAETAAALSLVEDLARDLALQDVAHAARRREQRAAQAPFARPRRGGEHPSGSDRRRQDPIDTSQEHRTPLNMGLRRDHNLLPSTEWGMAGGGARDDKGNGEGNGPPLPLPPPPLPLEPVMERLHAILPAEAWADDSTGGVTLLPQGPDARVRRAVEALQHEVEHAVAVQVLSISAPGVNESTSPEATSNESTSPEATRLQPGFWGDLASQIQQATYGLYQSWQHKQQIWSFIRQGGVARHPRLACRCLHDALRKRGIRSSAVSLKLGECSMLSLLGRVHTAPPHPLPSASPPYQSLRASLDSLDKVPLDKGPSHHHHEPLPPLTVHALPLGVLQQLVLQRMGLGCELVRDACRELLLQVDGSQQEEGTSSAADDGGKTAEAGGRQAGQQATEPGEQLPFASSLHHEPKARGPRGLHQAGGVNVAGGLHLAGGLLAAGGLHAAAVDEAAAHRFFHVGLEGDSWGEERADEEVVAPGIHLVLGEAVPLSARETFITSLGVLLSSCS